MTAVAAPHTGAPPPGSHEPQDTNRAIPHSSSKNQRLADALSSSSNGPSDGQSARPRPFAPFKRPNNSSSPFNQSNSRGSGEDRAQHTASPFRSSLSSDTDEQFQDVQDEFADPNEFAAPLREPPSPAVYSTRDSVGTHWDETEFQRQAADRTSKYSAVTRYDDGPDDDEYAGNNGGSSYDPAGDYDARSTYGHTRDSSIGSSIFAGKGAASPSPTIPPRKKKQPHQLQGASKPPPLPTSSAALQQLRDRGEALASPLSPSLTASPVPTVPAEEQTQRGPSQQLRVQPLQDSRNGLNSAYTSPNPSQGLASPSLSLTRSDGESGWVDAPGASASHNPQPSTEQRTMPDGTPYPPLPPIPSGKSTHPQTTKKRSDGSSGGGRRGRSPVLSFDGGVEAEERILNSPDRKDRLSTSDAGSDQQHGGSPKMKRALSHMGPKLRKNEPAPWEMDFADDEPERSSMQSSTPFPVSPNSQSAWSRLTRGSTDIRDKEGGETRRGLGLGVNLMRPSGEISRPSGETTRESNKASPASPRSKSRSKSFNGQSGSNSPHTQPPPLPTTGHERELTTSPPQAVHRGTPSLSGIHNSESFTTSNASERSVLTTTESREFQRMPERSLSPDSTVSVKQRRTRAKSVTSSAAKVFKDLTKGGSDKKDKQREDTSVKGSGGMHSNRLAKALKKRGEKDELSLAKGISSEDFKRASFATEAEGAQGAESFVLVNNAAQPESRPPPTAFNAASIRAAVNKDLVNPFAKSDRGSNGVAVQETDAAAEMANSAGGRSSDARLPKPTSAAANSDGPASSFEKDFASLPHSSAVNPMGSMGTFDSASDSPTPALRLASPRAPHRDLSLTGTSTSSMSSIAGSRQTPTNSNPAASRGIGLGYRKPSGVGTPSPTPSSNASYFGRAGRRQESSDGAMSLVSRTHASIDTLSSEPHRSPSASPGAPGAPGHHAIMAQQNIERRQTPATAKIGLSDSANTSMEKGTTWASASSSGEAELPDLSLPGSSQATLPTPGSHEGVPYKLISLEQAQAQQHARTREAANQRNASSAAGSGGDTHLDGDASISSHKSSDQSFSAGPGEENLDKESASKGLKNKKSGILRMFGRGGDKHREQELGQGSAGGVPPIPTSVVHSASPLQSLDSSYGLAASQSVKGGLKPSPGMSSMDSTQTLSPSKGPANLAVVPPALDVLRPVSSMFASLSPDMLDANKSDQQKVSKSPHEALAALQGDSIPEGTEEMATSHGDGEQVHRLAPNRPSKLASARGQVPSAIRVGEPGSSGANGKSLRSPSVASSAVTAADGGSDFHSPASSSAFGDHGMRSSGEDHRRHGGNTRPLQLVDRNARKASGTSGDGSQKRRSSTMSRDSETSSNQASGMMPAGSHRGDAGGLPEPARNRVFEIESKIGELLAELTRLRQSHMPEATTAVVDEATMEGGARLLTPTAPLSATTATSGASLEGSEAGYSYGREQGLSSPIPPASSPVPVSGCTTPVPPCSSCGCKCAEMKRLQAMNELQVLKSSGMRSPGGSVLERGRGVSKRPEESGRFGAHYAR